MSCQNKAICVLGSGRCGTSMVTRAINLLGVEVGSNLISADRTNPKGFWENSQIVMFHEKALKSLGFDLSKRQEEEIQPFKQELKDLVRSQFSNKQLWGWKDPRTCYFLKLWKSVLNDLGITINYLIMIRNPIDVAASFKLAYNADQKLAMSIWKQKTLLALRETYGEKRIIIDYNQFIDNSLKCLQKTSEILNLPWPQNENHLKKQLNEFVDPNLQHSRTGIENLLNNENIEEGIKELYQLCFKACNSPGFLDTEYFRNKIESL